MKTLRVFVTDWYLMDMPYSDIDNIFLWILKKKFNVIIDSENPDVLFYSKSDIDNYLNYKNCLKIYVNSEPGYYNDISKYDINHMAYKAIKNCDYMISSYKSNMENNYYLPVFMLWLYHHIYVTKIIESFESLTKSRNPVDKKYFCIFLHRNTVPYKRKEIFNKLCLYKKIHTKHDLNVPDSSLNKINIIKDFKFSFAMQNHFYKENHYAKNDNYIEYDIPGLIDEKILESLISNTIPIYYGNEEITKYFNKNSFLNYHDFNDDDRFIQEIINIDKNDSLSKEILSQPVFNNLNDLKINELENFLFKIID
jgi:hypothetical protein